VLSIPARPVLIIEGMRLRSILPARRAVFVLCVLLFGAAPQIASAGGKGQSRHAGSGPIWGPELAKKSQIVQLPAAFRHRLQGRRLARDLGALLDELRAQRMVLGSLHQLATQLDGSAGAWEWTKGKLAPGLRPRHQRLVERVKTGITRIGLLEQQLSMPAAGETEVDSARLLNDFRGLFQAELNQLDGIGFVERDATDVEIRAAEGFLGSLHDTPRWKQPSKEQYQAIELAKQLPGWVFDVAERSAEARGDHPVLAPIRYFMHATRQEPPSDR
jgi:hypothetical protein